MFSKWSQNVDNVGYVGTHLSISRNIQVTNYILVPTPYKTTNAGVNSYCGKTENFA